MYFDYNEGNKHLSAKNKLYNLILSRRVKLIDQNEKEYVIFMGDFKNEFLHLESFVMDYSSNVLFSNSTPIWKKFISNPHCSQTGYYGAYEELPCHNCVKENIEGDLLTGSSKYASFRPDIAFGYNGIHKVWIEIKDTNTSSISKLSFCKEKDIILLEVNAEYVLQLQGFHNNLNVNRLDDKMVTCDNKKDYSNVKNLIENKITKNKYISSKECSELIESISNGGNEYIDNLARVKYDLDLTVLENVSIPLQHYFGTKQKIYVKKDILTTLSTYEINFEEQIVIKVSEKIYELDEIIRKQGFMMQKDYNEEIIKVLPEGYKSKLNNYNSKLNTYNRIIVREIYDKLIDEGIKIDKKRKSGKIILSKKLYKKFLE